jgi:hypothetical protein
LSAKPENAPYETIVTEALERMRDLTAAAPSYEVDRSPGQWTVRRALKTTEGGYPADILAVLTGANPG